MKERLGNDFPAFLECYEKAPYRGLRVNTLKIDPYDFGSDIFPCGDGVEWEHNGYYITEEKAGADPYHFAGVYYLQEPSAMCAVPLFGMEAHFYEGMKVLDLCAAPGGKTTQLAQYMQGAGVLIANEIDPVRARILSQNVERMGVKNCAVVNGTPQRLAELYPAYFDVIFVDAPCSGEGMFRKEPEALVHWSEGNVKMCAARQRDILACANEMLTGDCGYLIYSTCTFSEEEDEGQIANFLKEHPEYTLLDSEKIYPHLQKGEGHYAAVLKKQSGVEEHKIKPYPIRRNSKAERAFEEFCEDFFGCSSKDLGRRWNELGQTIPPQEITTLEDGRMYLVPLGMPALDVRVLRLGVELGEWDGKIFKPAHALAMALGERAKRQVHLSREEAKRYLRGETLESDIPNGWCVVCVEDFPLGLGKAVNGVVKNHLPKGLRLIK